MSVSFSFFFPSFLSSTFHFIFNDSTTIVRPLSTTVQPITTAIRPLFGHHSAVVWPIIVVWPITTANRLSFGHCLAVFWPQFDRCSEVVQPLFGHHSEVASQSSPPLKQKVFMSVLGHKIRLCLFVSYLDVDRFDHD